MTIQKNRPEPSEEGPFRTVSIALEDDVLVARRCCDIEETKLEMNLSYVSGISTQMSKTVVGVQLLDFILEWIQSDTNEDQPVSD